MKKPSIRTFLFALALLSLPGFAAAQSASSTAPQVAQAPATQAPSGPIAEEGKFRLYKFEQAIGEETYRMAHDGYNFNVQMHFLFTDRGQAVPLEATFRSQQDFSPLAFEIKGKTSRQSKIDDAVEVQSGQIRLRDDQSWSQKERPASFFTISGYAPVTMQMLLVRYWASHGRPASLAAFPQGTLHVEARGTDDVDLGGRKISLSRYSIEGLIWGRETLWLDSSQKLAAVVTVDAEFDHFEAVREDCGPALGFFVSRAAQDGMAALADIGKSISGAHADKLALVGGDVIDATGAPTLHDATVLIQGGRIVAVGVRKDISIPKDAEQMDARGLTILPGLWDMHAHFEQVEWGPVYLASGVTTVRDVGNETEFITSVRDALASGKSLGPRMFLAGVVDGDSPFAIGINRINSPKQAMELVDKFHALGFQQMKIYSSVKLENLKAVCAEAHRLGMTVTGHIPNGLNAHQGVEAGMDQINHIQYIADIMHAPFPDSESRLDRFKAVGSMDLSSPEARHAVEFLKQHGTVIDDTLALFELLSASADHPVQSFEPGVEKVAPELSAQLTGVAVPESFAPVVRAMFAKDVEIVGLLHKAGVPIVAGTDQAVPGYSLHREMELYVKAGFTPMEAIQAATLVPARVMKMDSQLGTVETGKLADLILVEGDPLSSIQDVRRVKYVISNGTVYQPAPLWERVGFKP